MLQPFLNGFRSRGAKVKWLPIAFLIKVKTVARDMYLPYALKSK